MKNLILTAAILLFVSGVKAQEHYRTLSAGPKLGANMASATSTKATASEHVYGANGGIAVNYKLTKKHAVQTEFLYADKGFVQTELDVKNSLRYLEMPMLYQRTFFCCKKGGNIVERNRIGHFYLFAGPQLSVLLTSTAQFQSGAAIPEGNDKNIDLYPYTRPFDISAVVGIGYKMKNGLAIDVRYAQGLRHLNGMPNALIPGETYNTAVQAGVSYLLPINLK